MKIQSKLIVVEDRELFEKYLKEEKKLYNGYLKQLNMIDILAADAVKKKKAEDDLSNLVSKISSFVFPVFEKIGKESYTRDFNFSYRIQNFFKSYSEIGKNILKEDTWLFFDLFQSIINQKLRLLDDLENNLDKTIEHLEKEISKLKLEIEFLDDDKKIPVEEELSSKIQLKNALSGIKTSEK